MTFNGQFFFLPPIEGKVTGAIFIGEGEFRLDPVLSIEKKHISTLTHSPSLTDQFTKMAIRFTDSTYDEIKKQFGVQAGQGSAAAQSILDDSRSSLRRGRFFRYNLDGRILMDILSPRQAGLFQAFFHGKEYGPMIYGIDPLGNPLIAPEEVALVALSESNFGIWYGAHLTEHYRTPAVFDENHAVFDILNQKIDATIKGKYLEAVVETRFKSTVDGLRVLPFDLFSRLRVAKIADGTGRDIKFIQESRLEDADLFVLMPEALKKDQEYSLKFEYSGDEVVLDSGGGNFTLNAAARANWYPNNSGNPLGDRATFEMTFRVPKGLTMVATGQPLGESQEGDYSVSKWKSDVPLDVAGFNYGRFKKETTKDDKSNYVIESYANKDIPDYLKNIQQRADRMDDPGGVSGLPGGAPGQPGDGPGGRPGSMNQSRSDTTLGALNTVGMMDKARAEAQYAIEVYTDLFGPLPYGRVAMTQQPYFNFGQAWPTLVYMPVLAYLDSTYRHQLGMDRADSFVKIVGAHEVAHQWWGHILGWKSYRDQWMSEGFADFSASMYAQLVYKNDLFLKFWKEQRELIMRKDAQGKRPSDFGIVYMGYRLNTAKTRGIYREIVYPKGAFILHMLRMMMWDGKTGDQRFSEMMKDFVKSYYNSNVSTQDFQRIVEKHMTKDMDLDGNGKMNWFFAEWIYGAAIPTYKLDYRIEPAPNGSKLIGKITQSNVDDSFKMRVPLYADFDGKIRRLGSIPIQGNSTTEEFQVPLSGKPKKVMLCHYEDVLCDTDNR
jgi:hypothetical protein